MNGRYLLDTNIVIAFFNGDSEVAARIEDAPEVFLSSTVLGELFYGAANSGRPQENAARVRRFATACGVLEVTAETAELYGRSSGGCGRWAARFRRTMSGLRPQVSSTD